MQYLNPMQFVAQFLSPDVCCITDSLYYCGYTIIILYYYYILLIAMQYSAVSLDTNLLRSVCEPNISVLYTARDTCQCCAKSNDTLHSYHCKLALVQFFYSSFQWDRYHTYLQHWLQCHLPGIHVRILDRYRGLLYCYTSKYYYSTSKRSLITQSEKKCNENMFALLAFCLAVP